MPRLLRGCPGTGRDGKAGNRSLGRVCRRKGRRRRLPHYRGRAAQRNIGGGVGAPDVVAVVIRPYQGVSLLEAVGGLEIHILAVVAENGDDVACRNGGGAVVALPDNGCGSRGGSGIPEAAADIGGKGLELIISPGGNYERRCAARRRTEVGEVLDEPLCHRSDLVAVDGDRVGRRNRLGGAVGVIHGDDDPVHCAFGKGKVEVGGGGGHLPALGIHGSGHE